MFYCMPCTCIASGLGFWLLNVRLKCIDELKVPVILFSLKISGDHGKSIPFKEIECKHSDSKISQIVAEFGELQHF